jgi:hypothetical protein
MCNLCFCECRIAFLTTNNYKNRLAEIYDGLEVFGEGELANNLGIKTSASMRDEIESCKPNLRCDYNNEQESKHMLFKRLEEISSSDEMDAIWYIGQAFLKCRENLCFSPFKFSIVQRRIENIIRKYHDDFVKSHLHFGSGLSIIVPYLFDENNKVLEKVQAPTYFSTPVKKVSLREITNENRIEINKSKRIIIF